MTQRWMMFPSRACLIGISYVSLHPSRIPFLTLQFSRVNSESQSSPQAGCAGSVQSNTVYRALAVPAAGNSNTVGVQLAMAATQPRRFNSFWTSGVLV